MTVSDKKKRIIDHTLLQLESRYGQLPADVRILVVLSVCDGVTMDDIKDLTGVSKTKINKFLNIRHKLDLIQIEKGEGDGRGRKPLIHDLNM